MNNVEIAKKAILSKYERNEQIKLVANKAAKIVIGNYVWENEQAIKDFIEEYVFIYDSTDSALDAESYTFSNKYDILDSLNFTISQEDVNQPVSSVFLEHREYIQIGEDIWLYIQE